MADYEQAAAEHLSLIQNLAFLLVLAAAAGLGLLALFAAKRRISLALRARDHVEKAVRILLMLCSAVAILTTAGIVLSLFNESIRFFSFVNPIDFFFGEIWNPGFATTGSAAIGRYGLLPLLWGTVMVAVIAMLVALPVGLMTAIYLSQYAPHKVRTVVKPVIEILAGIPTIVYGFFALVTVGPFLSALGAAIGVDIRSTSALTA